MLTPMSGALVPIDDTCCVFQPVEVCTSGGSGGMVVGDAVTGGVANTVLYVDGAGDLGSTAGFGFNDSTSLFTVPSAIALTSDPAAAVSGAGGIRLRNNAGALEISANGGAYAPISASVAIGSAVAGSTDDAVLFIAGGGLLAQDADDFSYVAGGSLDIGVTTNAAVVSVHCGTTGTMYVETGGPSDSGASLTVSDTLFVRAERDVNSAVNTVLDALIVARGTSGVSSTAGVGASIAYVIANDTPAYVTAARASAALTTVTSGAEVSSYSISVLAAGALVTPFALTSSAATLAYENASTNTTLDVFDTRRTTSGTAAANLGAGHTMTLEDAGGTMFTASRYATIIQTATAGTPSSQVDIYTVAAGTLALQASFGSSSRGFYVPSTSRIAFGTPAANGSLQILSNICTFTMGTIAFGYSFTTGISSSGARKLMTFTAAAHTAQTAGTEINNFDINLSATKQWATGAITTQREIRIQAPTYAFVGASTITDAATFYINDAPQQGTNATITNAYALWIDAGRIRIDQGVALGGGAAPTLGTIGGSGPATAAQNQWLEITINGTRNWVPCWQ